MRLICQHCHKTIAYVCPFCGGELCDPRVQHLGPPSKVCENEQTQIYFTVALMPSISSTCEECRALGLQATVELIDGTPAAPACANPNPPKKVSRWMLRSSNN